MGLDLMYSANDEVFTTRFSMSDWATIEAIKAHLPHAVSVCFDVEEFGEPSTIALTSVRESVEQIINLLVEQPELLPYTYSFKTEYLLLGPKQVVFDDIFQTGGASGIRLPGDEVHWYTIWAGLNELRLEKMARQADGSGKVVEERDLRGEKELITTNFGRIQFRKRRAKTTLRKGLEEIRRFLSRVQGPQVTKILG